MREALAEADKGLGHTGPNPAVGAVLVAGDSVVARGYHHHAGRAHAEIEAMRDARDRGVNFADATLYVTLEPCAHKGRTGPCVDAIIENKIPRVVFGCRDPNPNVPGGGADKLRAAGVEVRGPVLQDECRDMIADFSLSIAHGRPYVVAKAAMSLDGRIALPSGESQWITGEPARALGRALRGKAQAVLTGIGTVLADDPQLTARNGNEEPLRVIFDSRLRTPKTARALGHTLIVAASDAPAGEWPGSEVWRMGTELLPALRRLYKERGFSRVLLESGAGLFGSAVAEQAIDELHLFVAPKILGAGPSFVTNPSIRKLSEALNFRWSNAERVGDDFYFRLRR